MINIAHQPLKETIGQIAAILLMIMTRENYIIELSSWVIKIEQDFFCTKWSNTISFQKSMCNIYRRALYTIQLTCNLKPYSTDIKVDSGADVGPVAGRAGGGLVVLRAHRRLYRVEHSRHCALEQSKGGGGT